MTEKQLAKRLAPWRPLCVGQRVVSLTYHKGQLGTVVERLGFRVDGLGYYGVKMDDSPTNTTDFVRCELKAVRRNRRLVVAKI
jgi:hypothetical protein